MAGRTVQRRVSLGRSRRRVAGRIGLADVRLGLDDDSGGAPATDFMDEHLADQILEDVERGATVKGRWKTGAVLVHRFRRAIASAAARLTCSSRSLRKVSTQPISSRVPINPIRW